MKKLNVWLCLVFATVLLSSCVFTATGGHHPRGYQTRSQGYGPPPHAPAHGYRHKYEHGVVLRYDTGLGAYLVIGHPNVYFYDGFFLRQHSQGYWMRSRHLAGPWQRGSAGDVPRKLERKMRWKYRGDERHEGRERR